jgi:hypothetical protein
MNLSLELSNRCRRSELWKPTFQSHSSHVRYSQTLLFKQFTCYTMVGGGGNIQPLWPGCWSPPVMVPASETMWQWQNSWWIGRKMCHGLMKVLYLQFAWRGWWKSHKKSQAE